MLVTMCITVESLYKDTPDMKLSSTKLDQDTTIFLIKIQHKIPTVKVMLVCTSINYVNLSKWFTHLFVFHAI